MALAAALTKGLRQLTPIAADCLAVVAGGPIRCQVAALELVEEG